mmetsp:Transcript_152609/g.489379  ORF Transcript_152609/g.489379 Transcript_152609/m.489379 type:complete len:305 (+) Transcript_152609:37-951(+)
MGTSPDNAQDAGLGRCTETLLMAVSPAVNTTAPSAARAFSRKLTSKVWSTVDLDEACEGTVGGVAVAGEKSSSSTTGTAVAVKVEPGSRVAGRTCSGSGDAAARSTASTLLQRSFATLGASAQEASAWSAGAESAAWAGTAGSCAPTSSDSRLGSRGLRTTDNRDEVGFFRLYRSEIRRLLSALKDRGLAIGLVERMRAGTLTAAELVVLSPEELLPEAKRARLLELRTDGPSESDVPKEHEFLDTQMLCTECGEAGGVSWEHMVTVREGYGKAETWGSSGNSDRGERCRAKCRLCLADWLFDL